jgi:8-oxo-dGTP pyrophosphatase MutT (NUDIX family)
MTNQQPEITDASGRRRFATSVAAVLGFIVDAEERILMLAQPTTPDAWQVVNGSLEREETILECVLRETSEEAGEHLRVRPLGVIHACTIHFDANVRYLISIYWLLAYEGGEVTPGSDMAGSEVRWFSVDELESGEVEVLVPGGQRWIFRRAVELYRLLKDRPPVELQSA